MLLFCAVKIGNSICYSLVLLFYQTKNIWDTYIHKYMGYHKDKNIWGFDKIEPPQTIKRLK